MTVVPPTSGRMRWALICLVVVVFQLYAAHGFETVLDLHVSDECAYLGSGRKLFEGSPDWRGLVAWSGPYHVLYGLLDLAHLGTRVQDVMCVLLALASSFALLWALSGLASLEAAAAATFLCACGSPYVGFMNGVYVFGATVLFLAAGFLVRGREVLGATFALLAAATRPELMPWMGSAGLVAALLGRRRAGLVVAVGAAALLVLQLSVDDRDRSGLAFRQHYAHGAAERKLREAGSAGSAAERPGQAFADADRWVRESFGDARTLPRALAANPRELGRHVLGNLSDGADQLIPLAGRFPASRAAQRGVALVLGFLAVLGLVDLVGAMRRGRACCSPGSTWMTALVLFAPMVAATSILYGPRVSYLLSGFLPVVILALRGPRRLRCLRILPGFRGRVHGLRPSAWVAERLGLARRELGVLGLALLLLAAVWVPRPSDRPPLAPLRWRKILTAAERHGGDFAVLGDPGFASALLSPGDKLFSLHTGVRDDVHRVLLHGWELCDYTTNGLLPVEDEQLRRILEDGGWRPQSYSDEVLLIVREGT